MVGLQILVKYKSVDVLSEDKANRTALSCACEKGNVDISRLLLFAIRERHGKEELSKVLKSPCLEGKTSLYYATRTGKLELVKLLLKYGHAGLKTGDRQGATPLHFASKEGKLEIVKLIADASDLLGETDDGYTAFSYAAAG